MKVHAKLPLRPFGRLAGVSAGALVLSMMMPAAAFAQAAEIPNSAAPGTPAQTDPAPTQTAVVPQGGDADPAAVSAPAAAPAEAQEGEIIVTGFRR